MNSAAQITKLVDGWKAEGLPNSQIVVNTAEAEIGWCYVWGATGQNCTPSARKQMAGRTACPSAESELTLKKCQVTREVSPKANCVGCKWYPNNERTLMDDCQGFVKQVCGRVGIRLSGGGCTSMWNNKSNWASYGAISTLPKDKVCCVFWTDTTDRTKKSHIGFYIGNGQMIHCSGEVKKEALSAKCTDWAIPKGLDDTPVPVQKPTLRRGDRGEYVTLAQTELIQKGYPCGSFGADGQFGAATEKAVRAFQKDHTDQDGNPLTVDGVIGQKTWWALDQVEPTILYTVTVPHLTKAQADSLIAQYPGSTRTEERGNQLVL